MNRIVFLCVFCTTLGVGTAVDWKREQAINNLSCWQCLKDNDKMSYLSPEECLSTQVEVTCGYPNEYRGVRQKYWGCTAAKRRKGKEQVIQKRCIDLHTELFESIQKSNTTSCGENDFKDNSHCYCLTDFCNK